MDHSFKNGFSGPKSVRKFRETGHRSRDRRGLPSLNCVANELTENAYSNFLRYDFNFIGCQARVPPFICFLNVLNPQAAVAQLLGWGLARANLGPADSRYRVPTRLTVVHRTASRWLSGSSRHDGKTWRN